jgi:hypothetical protein
MDFEFIRLGLTGFAGICVTCVYWSFIGIFTEKKWIKTIISLLMMGITIYLYFRSC